MLVVGEIGLFWKDPNCVVALPHDEGGNLEADIYQIALGLTDHQKTLASSLILGWLLHCEIHYHHVAH